MTINNNTFRSYVDHSELLWGGTYFVCQRERPALFCNEDVFNSFVSGVESREKSASLQPIVKKKSSTKIDEEFMKAEEIVKNPKTMFGT